MFLKDAHCTHERGILVACITAGRQSVRNIKIHNVKNITEKL